MLMTRILVLVVAAALVSPAAGGETPIDLAEIRQNLFAACFPTDREGWMVGELGRVIRTTDGGTTWRRQDAGTKRPFLAMACLDPRTAWIAGKEGIIYATTDGGETWRLQKSDSTRHIFTIDFATPMRGHAAGDFGTMVHTEDGGATWTSMRVPETVALPDSALDTGVEPGDVNIYSLSYGDADRVWAVGEFGVVVTSADGGRTWQQQHTPVESTLFGVRFVDARRGWAVGIDSLILRTEDGGATWVVQPPPISQRSLYDVAVRGANGWIVGDSGTVFKSVDGGSSWTSEQLPIQLAARWLRSVTLSKTGAGLAVGAEGLVYRVEGPAFRRLESKGARS
jgi:photosystem II stability/assembly factor-like uncharacterized protein